MAVHISKTVTKPFLYTCLQRSIDMRWSHSSIMSTQLLSSLLRKTSLKTNVNALLMYSQKVNIPLPSNVRDINAIETARFSPQRNRDLTGDMISAQTAPEMGTATDVSSSEISDNDYSVDSYDCTGTVSLNSAMQTNVPQPFSPKKKAPVHLNMPGGEWSRSDKYIADDMQNALFNSRADNQEHSSKAEKGIYALRLLHAPELHHRVHGWSASQMRLFSTSSEPSDNKNKEPPPPPGYGGKDIPLSNKDKIMRAIKQYGPVVVVFHTSISLMSLGICYLAVKSGVDFKSLEDYLPGELPGEVGGFVIAYAVHKTLSPLRVGATLFCVPFIVKYLRQKGLMRTPRVFKYYEKPQFPRKSN